VCIFLMFGINIRRFFFVVEVYPLIKYTDPSTGEPSFEGNVAFVVTSSPPQPRNGYFDLSSIPTSVPSASWQALASAWWANQTTLPEPVEDISVAVCYRNYSIQPWVVDLIDGSAILSKQQSLPVENIDPTQLNIAIQDCFYQLPDAHPISIPYNTSKTQLELLFNVPDELASSPSVPYSSDQLTSSINKAIPISVQAYLDNFPFGNFTPTDSMGIVPALVLSAELKFVYATAALYALLSTALLFLFNRPVAKPLTIQKALSLTGEAVIPHMQHLSRGRALAAEIERIAAISNDADDSATEARINTYIGDHYTIVRGDPANHNNVLETDLQKNTAASSLLLKQYENLRTRGSRIAWVFTPILGAILVVFGITAWRHPLVVSHKSPNSGTTSLFSLFTWCLGLWRSISLLAVSGLIQQGNSDVSTLHVKSILTADCPLLCAGMDPSA
jgi:hypothetical protein